MSLPMMELAVRCGSRSCSCTEARYVGADIRRVDHGLVHHGWAQGEAGRDRSSLVLSDESSWGYPWLMPMKTALPAGSHHGVAATLTNSPLVRGRRRLVMGPLGSAADTGRPDQGPRPEPEQNPSRTGAEPA